ncbi:uncharacterized protein LOC116125517 [Pistacia vera]|uniref:uncharacterized protein LOC116125517 n=1 Tax=Pistacia vera TaxID=55513 RepID=UPI0012632D84|nr:uncharacterized protein LOC116125517 [Pistacia vera]
MPKSTKLFKLNWASSEPHEKKPVPKPVVEKKSMGKSTSGVSSSWADKVRVIEVGSHFTLETVDLDIKDDILLIPDDVIDDNDVEWLRYIVGYFPGYSMPFHVVRSIAFRACEAAGLEDVMSIGTGFYIFRFRDEDAFTFDKSRISKVPVWAHLHGLPYPLWSHKGVCMVFSMLGGPLSSDKTTSERTRLDYARVCVALDAAKPLRRHFEFQCRLSAEPIQITVEYEWTLKRCPKCCVFGHVCHQPEVPTVAIAQGQSKNCEPLRQSATIDPIRERERDVSMPSAVSVSVSSTVRVGDASLALVPYQQTVRASRGEFSGFESGSESDSPFPIEDEQDWSWNIRGLNGFSKQRAMWNWISDSSLGLIGLLETKVKQSHLQSVASLVCPSWQFLSNATYSIACRVLVCWDSSLYSVNSLHCSLQEITCRVTHVSKGFSFRITFVYGSNDLRNRRNLWDFLRDQSAVFDSEGLPWLVFGEFNTILGAFDRVGGDPALYGYMDDFRQCIHDAELIGVPFTRLRYTWHNGQQGDGIILWKLDWVFASLSWFLDRPNIVSEF